MGNISKYKEDLGLALELAGLADNLSMQRFEAADLSIKNKADDSPVTDADLAIEKLLREKLAHARPKDQVMGEEYGGKVKPEGRQWLVDPIDGTKSYYRGVPVWATIITLLIDGVPVVGVVSAPALRRRWYASQGAGAFRVFGGQPKRLRVSSIEDIEEASLAVGSLQNWKKAGLYENLLDLAGDCWRMRGYGDFWNYCLVAEGAVDIAMEAEASPWDLAAPAIIVKEAGGAFTDLKGVRGPFGGSAVATNGRLHASVLRTMDQIADDATPTTSQFMAVTTADGAGATSAADANTGNAGVQPASEPVASASGRHRVSD